MEWLIFAILSSFFNSFAVIIEKGTLRYEHALQFNTIQATLTFLMMVPFAFLVDFNSFTPYVLILSLITALLGAAASLLLTKSTRHLDLSIVSPMTIMGPALTSFLAVIFLHESLSVLQWIGIFVMLIGSYCIEQKGFKHILKPIKSTVESKFIFFIIFGLLIFGVCSILDKILVSMTDFFSYLFLVHFFLAIYFVIFTCVKFSYNDITSFVKNKAGMVSMIVISFFILLRRLFYIWAVSLGPVSIVNPIKRSSQLISAVLGGKIYHEKYLFHKFVSGLIMFGGLMMLLLL